MNQANTQRKNNEAEKMTNDSNNLSAMSLIDEYKHNNKTEQIKLRRNLLQASFEIKEVKEETSTPDILSENSSIIAKTPENPDIPLISFEEAYKYFYSQIMPNNQTNQEEKSSGICSCSSEKLQKEKTFVMVLNKIKYDKNNDIHFRILFTIYYFLTKKNCPKEGEHWQNIGFQGNSPSPDLYPIGMYGPLQILYGFNKYPNFYTNLFEYLVKRKCDLFFAGNLISFVKFSYNTFERGIIDSYVKEEDNLFFVLSEVYVGMGYDFYYIIQQYGNGNILTIEFIVKTIQNISDKRIEPSPFLKNHSKNY